MALKGQTEAVHSRKVSISSVLLIDNQDSFVTRLGRSFRDIGCETWWTDDAEQARSICEVSHPDLVVTELRVQGRFIFDSMGELKNSSLADRIVVATNFPSAASAVWALRLGFDAYFVKPVDAQTVLAALSDKAAANDTLTCQPPASWPSLDLTIWEYINQVYFAAGSLSEAARRLGLHRRSLQRMLNKHPPTR